MRWDNIQAKLVRLEQSKDIVQVNKITFNQIIKVIICDFLAIYSFNSINDLFFYFVKLNESYETKKNLSKLDHWIVK